MIYFLKGMTKSLLVVGVGGVLASLIPRLVMSKFWPREEFTFLTQHFIMDGFQKLHKFICTVFIQHKRSSSIEDIATCLDTEQDLV